MPDKPLDTIDDMGREDLLRLVLELLHRSWMHYGLWFQAAQAQMEPDRFPAAERQVFGKNFAIAMKRLGGVLGFAVDEDGVPQALRGLDQAGLAKAARAVAANWYAADGIWFQQIEQVYDMDMAKRANDSVWARYAPYEAQAIALHLGLPPACGLDGLRRALPLRSAALINDYAYQWEDDGALVLRVTDCRIQRARARRGLPDYPCRSAGQVEHVFFARALDPRITTQCLGCPPGPHPPEWFCAWRFRVE